MNYSLNSITIKNNWFEGKDNKYKSIGHEGLFLYLTLFRFYIGNQKEYSRYTFSTSIGQLRKETGYSAKRIDELIRLLVRYGIIRTNISRWAEYMYEGETIKADKHFIAYSTDHPLLERVEENELPIGVDNYYLIVDLNLIQHYRDKELHERYLSFYCLLKKLSNNNQGKSWMSMDKMAEVLGVSNNTVGKMIRVLNEEMLLATYYKESENNRKRLVNGEKVDGKSSEHHLLYSLEMQNDFIKTHKRQIKRNLSEWGEEKS